jgi:hypothetical protein
MENDKAEHNVELSPMQLLPSYRAPSGRPGSRRTSLIVYDTGISNFYGMTHISS